MGIKIVYVGFVDDSTWPHFLWNVLINNESFQYKTGVGHSTLRVKNGKHVARPKDINCIIEKDKYIHVPKEINVLDCLFSDADAGDMTFDDFCASFGYDSDSIKAFNVYNTCIDTRKRLKKALGAEYQQEYDRIQKMRDEGLI